ncbi:MAG: SH3 domain-containing protein [Chloroflexi bacterium]|nr:SH3 domain-containing protein [Chloroflexota bacterium]
MASEPMQQVQFVTPRLVVNTSFLNVRSGPGIQYSVLLTVVGGTELPVLARAKDNVWFQVSTVIGVGWVNVQYTVPRGSFDLVPIVNTSDISAFAVLPSVPSSLALPAIIEGQGGGGPVVVAPVAAASVPSSGSGSPIRIVYDNNQRVTSVRPGERFRITINVEAVNIRTEPRDGAPALGTLYRDASNDYTLVSSARDAVGTEWFAIDAPDIGTGWIEAPKTRVRLSRLAGQVMVVKAQTLSLLDSPGGSGTNMPILNNGDEAFLVGASQDGKFLQVELAGGQRGWLPSDAITARTDTPTDRIDLSQVPTAAAASAATVVVQPDASAGVVVVPTFPQSFGLDTPHVVVNTGFLNIRSGPGAQYTTVATVPGGTELPVLGIAKDGVWYLVQGVFGRGWVNGEFTLFRGSIDAVPIIYEAAGTVSTPVAIVAASAVTLYAAPGTNFGVIGNLAGPVEVPIVARTIDSQWLQLSTPLGFGWVLASQIILQGDLSLVPIVG